MAKNSSQAYVEFEFHFLRLTRAKHAFLSQPLRMRLLLFLSSTLSVVYSVSFIPKRTPIRDKIFLGIKDEAPAPMVATGAIVVLPPAASIQGVNATALSNSDLHEYGSMGVPPEIAEARKTAAETAAAVNGAPAPKSFLNQQSSSSAKETARHALDFFSVLWLVVVLVACVVFLGAALREANKKRKIVLKKPESASHARKVVTGARSRPASVADKRIDREAYVYVDGG